MPRFEVQNFQALEKAIIDVEIVSSKNKISGFHLPVKMTIVFGRGVSNVMYVFEKLKEKGYVKQSSSYFIFSTPMEEKTVQGREAAMVYVRDNYRQLQVLLSSDGVETESEEVQVPESQTDDEESLSLGD